MNFLFARPILISASLFALGVKYVMMEIVQVILQNANSLSLITLESLIIFLLVAAIIYLFKFYIKLVKEEKICLLEQIDKHEKTIHEMTSLLSESEKIIIQLSNTVENNKEDILIALDHKISLLQQTVINFLSRK